MCNAHIVHKLGLEVWPYDIYVQMLMKVGPVCSFIYGIANVVLYTGR